MKPDCPFCGRIQRGEYDDLFGAVARFEPLNNAGRPVVHEVKADENNSICATTRRRKLREQPAMTAPVVG